MLPLVLAAALLGAAPAIAGAAERTMSWDAVEVEARLDARGDLHVRERQAIRFHGAWNGAERRFRVGPGQRLRFERLLRETPAGAVEVPAGDLGTVDRYAFPAQDTLRWRSRAARDPPFAGEVLGYVLEYTLERVLLRAEDGIFLEHDLAFPDRDWPIARARGRVVLDPAWQLADGTLEGEGAALPPGAGLVLQARLRWVGAGPAPEVPELASAASPPEPDAPPAPPGAEPLPEEFTPGLAPALAVLLLGVALTVYRHARRQGQLSPSPGVGDVDRRFLDEHLLAWPPEVVAAAWAGHVGPSAVAAVIAGHCAAGRIDARREGKTLHLRLRAPRDAFEGGDAALVQKLFPDGDTTDTEQLRARYRGSGFDPAGCIRSDTERRLRDLDGPLAPDRRRLRVVAGAPLLLALLVGFWGSGDLRPGEATFWHVLDVLVLPVALAFAACGAATWLASSVRRLWRPAAALAALLCPWAVAVVLRARAVGGGETVWTFGAHLLGWTSATLMVAAYGRTRLHPDAILFRRRIAAARDWLALELGTPAPRLKDGWAPWLVALGLSRDADRWFAAHAAAASSLGRERSGGSGSTASGSTTWTGGGGLFSGGGASGSWAALGSVARSYPSPPSSSSSSRSSSSSSSRSSSGGGGGGGW